MSQRVRSAKVSKGQLLSSIKSDDFFYVFAVYVTLSVGFCPIRIKNYAYCILKYPSVFWNSIGLIFIFIFIFSLDSVNV